MPLKTTAEEPVSLNLTSMIDVLFLLVLFFMAATKFAEMEHKLVVRVPQVKDPKGLEQADAPKTITVASDGRIEFAGRQVTLAALPGLLQEAKRKQPQAKFALRCDRGLPLEQFAEVLLACRGVVPELDLPTTRKKR